MLKVPIRSGIIQIKTPPCSHQDRSDYAMLCPKQAKPEDTLDLSRLLNDDITATANARPERFVALGTLPMQAPLLAVQEMKRAVGESCSPVCRKGVPAKWRLGALGRLEGRTVSQCLGMSDHQEEKSDKVWFWLIIRKKSQTVWSFFLF